jgi:raffinose/stachyose/melibiose transport system permease protein
MKSFNAKQKKLFWIWIFLIPCVLVFLLFYLEPIITLIITSFTSWDGANAPVFDGLTNYINLFKSPDFQKALLNLLIWSVIAATAHTGFAVLIALYLYKNPIGGRFVRVIYMVPNVIAAAAWAMIYKYFFDAHIGILNAIIQIFIPGFAVPWLYQSPYALIAIILTWLFYGVIGTLIVLGELRSIPSDLHEAARIDGASEWYITRKINLPLCRQSIGTTIIISISARISMYEMIALTTHGGPSNDTMNLPLIVVNAISNNHYGYANAVGSIMFVLGIVMLLVVNKVMKMNESVY